MKNKRPVVLLRHFSCWNSLLRLLLFFFRSSFFYCIDNPTSDTSPVSTPGGQLILSVSLISLCRLRKTWKIVRDWRNKFVRKQHSFQLSFYTGNVIIDCSVRLPCFIREIQFFISFVPYEMTDSFSMRYRSKVICTLTWRVKLELILRDQWFSYSAILK